MTKPFFHVCPQTEQRITEYNETNDMSCCVIVKDDDDNNDDDDYVDDDDVDAFTLCVTSTNKITIDRQMDSLISMNRRHLIYILLIIQFLHGTELQTLYIIMSPQPLSLSLRANCKLNEYIL